MNKIHVSKFESIQNMLISTELDEYVPLRFKTYDGALGASRIYIRGGGQGLAVLIIDPESSALRGFTLTSFEDYEEWPNEGRPKELDGLPVINGHFESGSNVEIGLDLHVALKGRDLLVWWGDPARVSVKGICGRFQSLVCGDELIGIKVSQLSDEDTQLLRGYGSR